jgi:hypothetical protein
MAFVLTAMNLAQKHCLHFLASRASKPGKQAGRDIIPQHQ